MTELLPSNVVESVWHRPLATISTRTSPLRGGSTEMVSMVSGAPGLWRTAALDSITVSASLRPLASRSHDAGQRPAGRIEIGRTAGLTHAMHQAPYRRGHGAQEGRHGQAHAERKAPEDTEMSRQNDGDTAAATRTDRHTCGVWSRQEVVVRSGEVGLGRRPGVWARRSDVDADCRRRWRDPGWSRRVVVSDRVKGHGEPGFGPRAVEVVAARCSGAWAYLRHAAAAGDMKPCGHDHRELTHGARPHQLVGHADAASRPVAVARSHAASVVRQRISPSRSP